MVNGRGAARATATADVAALTAVFASTRSSARDLRKTA
jgi:hypothetical protein